MPLKSRNPKSTSFWILMMYTVEKIQTQDGPMVRIGVKGYESHIEIPYGFLVETVNSPSDILKVYQRWFADSSKLFNNMVIFQSSCREPGVDFGIAFRGGLLEITIYSFLKGEVTGTGERFRPVRDAPLHVEFFYEMDGGKVEKVFAKGGPRGVGISWFQFRNFGRRGYFSNNPCVFEYQEAKELVKKGVVFALLDLLKEDCEFPFSTLSFL